METTGMNKNQVLELALNLKRAKRLSEARELFNDLLSTSHRKRAMLELLSIETKIGSPDNVIKYYDELIMNESDHASRERYIKDAAQYATAVGKLKSAERELEKLLESNPYYKRSIKVDLGKLYFKLGKNLSAKKLFNEVIQLASFFENDYVSEVYDANLGLANIDVSEMNLDAAEEKFKFVMTIGGEYKFMALSGLFKVAALKGKIKQAKSRFKQALELIGNDKVTNRSKETLIKNYLILLLTTGNIEAARELLQNKQVMRYYRSFNRDKGYIDLYVSGMFTEENAFLEQERALERSKGSYRNTFLDGVDTDDLFNKIIQILKDSEPNSSFFNGIYHIECDDYIATVDGENTKCVCVVTYMDKSNITTIYPVIWEGATIKLNQKIRK